MKLSGLFLILPVLLLAGCSAKYVPYDSVADVPSYSKSTASNLKYIKGGDTKRDYRVFAGIDVPEEYYLLFAPKKTSLDAKTIFDQTRLSNAATLSVEHSLELAELVDTTLMQWPNRLPEGQIKYLEYQNAPEHKIETLSENVKQWYPTLRYVFQMSESKPIVVITFGRGIIQFQYELRDKEEIEDLANLLALGIQDLKSRGFEE